MIVGSNILAGASGQQGYFLQRSVRLRSSASAYFNRTPASASNRTTWTWSAWIKRGALSAQQTIFSSGNGSGDSNLAAYNQLVFDATTNSLDFIEWLGAGVGGSGVMGRKTTSAVYRDCSAWYHIVAVYNTTSATAEDRMQIWVNGVRITAWSANSLISQNFSGQINSTYAQNISSLIYGTRANYFDGYLTEINFVDGQALTPSSFGEYNTITGVWQPKKYGGTYGTNGFYLNFNDNSAATAAAIGKDSSGNGNNWTPNNISVTAGVTYDSMTDVPTLTSATTANYAVMNPIAYTQYSSLTDGNLALLTSITVTGGTNGTIGVNSGKWYWEITIGATGTPSTSIVGIRNQNANVNSAGNGYPGGDSNGYGYYANTGQKYTGATGFAYGATYTSGDVIGVAFDADSATLTFYKNNVSQGTAFTGIVMTNNSWFPAFGDGSTGFQCLLTANFGQRPFSYTPPTGFVALNTYNLPTPTIANGANQFAATTYTGNGSTQSIVNTVNGTSFQPDLVWYKRRNTADNHRLFDAVRGVTKPLFSDLTSAESTESGVTAFNSNGFTLGLAGNESSNTYVGWQWKASNAAAVTNTSGSITSQVSANPSAGFSIVTYTGTGANATVGHGLGIAPKMLIVKRRNSTSNWPVLHTSISGSPDNFLYLNSTSAVINAGVVFNSTTPTSTIFGVGTDASVNASGGTYVAYCFAEIAGYSKAFSYTGNGLTDGTFVYCGFRPRWIMIKKSSATGNWSIVDTSRDTFNVADNPLLANTSGAETTSTSTSGAFLDILSNGFKLRGNSGDINDNTATYIGFAVAENPFNYSLAR
jgi:hypothetical protein